MQRAWRRRDIDALKRGENGLDLDLPPNAEMKKVWQERESKAFLRGTEKEPKPTQEPDLNWQASPEMESAWAKREAEAAKRRKTSWAGRRNL